ncbi:MULTISPECIES: EF-P lysine aminoacylase EpmA [unclassified Saccharibacter]|uniref:EF-P lysine aminoacylase EpmA n=1 Tax=unclassified Saccharibacter TaxID=2648722 RepID=UPI001323D6DF|nr:MULTISPECIES: EF-P lysine aminoacylase EpmA [unclassified Saccharibacter]MXV34956.1 EF-P lysine aminoacylase GenX [Saccharibacter sp. EH611]MXV57498.1 EF-P lysine aminoacylase GenX [Saccharibacter sp. EH70]MXV64641.1 EF-P lysine aminoacylase GenX [Saccharibacter sp. EH60]
MTVLPPYDHSLTDRLPLLRRRARMLQATRAFFDGRGYMEVETPYVVPVPGEEVHLRCFRTTLEHPDGTHETRFLHTSPEFAMKRLVAGLHCPIFQLARVWRNGERSATHHPEFTMLEWYRTEADLSSLMDETEALLHALLPPSLRVGETLLDLTQPFERLTMHEAFLRYVGADVLQTEGDAQALAQQAQADLREGENWEDLFFRLLLERIEPHIGRERPTFLTHWPSEQAALARRDPHDPRVALRFELYAGGVELANAFEELTDSHEQRRRFEADRQRRLAYTPDQDWAVDEAFLQALPHMPPTSGIALGFDRLVMLATGAPRIEDVLWLS